MAHGHGHSHGGSTGWRLGLSLLLTLAFTAGEAVAGFAAGSLALLSDAAHNLADAVALLLSWYALRVGRRPADARRTFGYGRAGILAALANGLTLVGLALLIFREAARRLRHPEPVAGGLMIGVALAAVAVNGAISLWLRGAARHDLNVRSAYLHMLGDAASALGVVAAGAVVTLTGEELADPVASLLIGGLILWSSFGVLREAVDVLLEAAPSHLDVEEVARAVRGVPGVVDAHHLHVWTVGSGEVSCSCHVVVAEQSVREGQAVLRAVEGVLRERFGIVHTTIQLEPEGCPDGADCFGPPPGEPHAGHGHGHGAER
jgi:cobalt-zinc-cadmium efflux system protein